MSDNIIERLNKLKAMIEGGTENERENAGKLYELLIKKYDIDEKEIKEKEIGYHEFKCNSQIEMDLMIQIHVMVTDNCEYNKYIDKRRKNYVLFKCSDEDFEIMKLYFNIYNESLKKELQYFLLGFFVKNDIHGKHDSDDKEQSSLSLEERNKILNYVDNIDYVNKPYRLLEG